MPLNPRQQLFVEVYITCWNATKAAKEAGYSAKTAHSIGAENLKKINIRAEIDKRLGEAAMTANETLARLTDHARGTAADFLVVAGEPDDASIALVNFAKAQAAGKLHLVKKFKIGAKGDMSFELYDAQKALTTLARIHGLIASGPTSDGDGGNDTDADEEEEMTEADVARELKIAGS